MPICIEVWLAALDVIEGEASSIGVALKSRRPTFDGCVRRHRIRAFVRLTGILQQPHVQLFLVRRDKHEPHVRVASQRFVAADGFDHGC